MFRIALLWVPYSGNILRVKTFANFAVLKQFAKVLVAKILNEFGGESVGIMDVPSLSVARQYLSNSSFPNRQVDMVASNNSLHYVALSSLILIAPIQSRSSFPAHALL